jgi:type VI secretion system protein VasL
MTSSQSRILKAGGDPRALAEYAALRQEMQKLSHPARPDVEWPQVCALCQTLFEKNGVELQSAVWYTLSRAHVAGCAGMSEGLSVLVVLLTREWATFWPQSIQARVELLAGLSRRLQQFLRSQTLTQADLAPLEQAVNLLNEAGDQLQQRELRQQSQLDPLRDRIRSAVMMLASSEAPPPVALAAETAAAPLTTLSAVSPTNKWVYVPAAKGDARKPDQARWPMFVAGAASTMLLGTMIAAGFYFSQKPPLQHELLASVAPIPELLKPESVAALKANPPAWLNDGEWLKQTQQQLDWLLAASPNWPLQYGSALVQQTHALLPNADAVAAMTSSWNTQLQAAAMPADQRAGWQQGMEQLKNLAQRLDELDEKRGKYLTVSELKTAVYGIQKAFDTSIPFEELLRQLQAQRDAGKTITQAQTLQTELHLKQLATQYLLITQ